VGRSLFVRIGLKCKRFFRRAALFWALSQMSHERRARSERDGRFLRRGEAPTLVGRASDKRGSEQPATVRPPIAAPNEKPTRSGVAVVLPNIGPTDVEISCLDREYLDVCAMSNR